MSVPLGTNSLEVRLERLKHASDLRAEAIRRYFDGVPDGTEDGVKNHRNNYVNGADELQLHFDAIRPLCTTFRAGVGDNRKGFAFLDNFDVKGASARSKHSMFVWIGNGAKGLRPITSFVRLQFLDCCHMRGAKSYKFGRNVSREFLWRITNRELSAVLDGARIEAREFKDKIVQGRSKVVTDIPQHNTDDGRMVKDAYWRKCMNAVRRIRIEINSSRLQICLPESGQMVLQLCKMFLCPIYPLESAVKWMKDAHNEITKAMISASESALLGALGGAVEVFWNPSDPAISV